MAPSTPAPSALHRAQVACHSCRAAKVRCLISQRSERCDRCITHDTHCVFSQPARSRTRDHPYARLPKRAPTLQKPAQKSIPLSTSCETSLVHVLPTPINSLASPEGFFQHSVITAETRERIIATLSSLKGRRGAPFSFITSGDGQPPGTRLDSETAYQQVHTAQSHEHSKSTTPSLKLSWLLRPLKSDSEAEDGGNSQRDAFPVHMPSYTSSVTLGQTITDPIEGGILTRPVSMALFEHFMLEMNSKWEYVLDPHVDTHDDVRQRSQLLFATVLFCSSKFSNYVNDSLSATADPFLQIRLCSLARNLAVKMFALGDKSVETMQAYYLLVCWKDPDDDVSYLHSGYAFRILQDLDLDQTHSGKRQATRKKRTWLALFRQDRQQSLFFTRRASLSVSDDDLRSVGDLDTWVNMPYALPLDFIACCSGDLRRIQSRLRIMVQKASLAMLPCLEELMDFELSRWKSTWQNQLEGKGRVEPKDDISLNQRLLYPGNPHVDALIGTWEYSIRLNVASAILRQALILSVTSRSGSREQPSLSTLGFGLPALGETLPPDFPGLSNSVEGAFGTLRHLLKFPCSDLRRAPDSIALLGPNSALFLCLLLCFPRNGVLGPSFQKTAVSLIRDLALRVRQSVQSPGDTMALHSAYLDSLVILLGPAPEERLSSMHESAESPAFDLSHFHTGTGVFENDEPPPQTAHTLAGGSRESNLYMGDSEGVPDFLSEPEHSLHMQSIANLLDNDFFWAVDVNSGVHLH